MPVEEESKCSLSQGRGAENCFWKKWKCFICAPPVFVRCSALCWNFLFSEAAKEIRERTSSPVFSKALEYQLNQPKTERLLSSEKMFRPRLQPLVCSFQTGFSAPEC